MSKYLAKSIIVAGLLLQSLQAEDSLFNFDKLTDTIGKSVNGLLSKDTNTTAEQPVIKKKVAIVLDPVRSPDGLLDSRVVPEFKKALDAGMIKSYSKATDTVLGLESSRSTVIDFNLLTEEKWFEEQRKIKTLIENGLEKNPDQSVSKYTLILSHNIIFGDKAAKYMKNPYQGCFRDNALKNLLKDFDIVESSANPDYVIKIAVDTCLTQSEFEPLYAKYRGLPLDNFKPKRDSNTSADAGLVRDGVQTAAISNNPQGNQVGMAMAGVGIGLAAVGWLLSPSDHDMVRLKATFEGKDKKTFTFYPTSYSGSSHDKGQAVHPWASGPVIYSTYNNFLAWEKNDKAALDKISVLSTEKDLLKAVAAARDEEAKKKEAK